MRGASGTSADGTIWVSTNARRGHSMHMARARLHQHALRYCGGSGYQAAPVETATAPGSPMCRRGAPSGSDYRHYWTRIDCRP